MRMYEPDGHINLRLIVLHLIADMSGYASAPIGSLICILSAEPGADHALGMADRRQGAYAGDIVVVLSLWPRAEVKDAMPMAS